MAQDKLQEIKSEKKMNCFEKNPYLFYQVISEILIAFQDDEMSLLS